MATASREIEIVIKSKDLASGEIEDIIQKITKIGPKSESVSKQVAGHSGLMRLGMFSAGESVEFVAGKFGIMGQAGRQVGNVVEGMIGRMGKFAGVIGGASIVIGGAVMIWKHFSDVQQKHREEVMKTADSMLSMTSRYDAASPAVRRLADAQYVLAEAERKLKLLALADAILLQGIEADKAREKHEKLTAAMLSGKSGEIPLSVITASLQKMGLEADVAAAKAKVLQEQWNVFSQSQGRAGEGKEKENQAFILNQLQEVNNRAELIGLDRDQRELTSLDQRHASERAKLQEHYTNKLQMDKAEGDLLLAQRGEREQLILDQNQRRAEAERRIDEQIMQYKMSTITSGLDALNAITHGKYKILFLATRGMSAANAIIHGYSAAAAAIAPPPIGLGPVAGAPLAAWAKISGYASAAAIMAQAFTGPGGGGGGSSSPPIGGGGGGGTEGISTGGGGAVRYETNITLNTGAVLASSAELQNLVDGYIIPAIDDAASRNITGNA